MSDTLERRKDYGLGNGRRRFLIVGWLTAVATACAGVQGPKEETPIPEPTARPEPTKAPTKGPKPTPNSEYGYGGEYGDVFENQPEFSMWKKTLEAQIRQLEQAKYFGKGNQYLFEPIPKDPKDLYKGGGVVVRIRTFMGWEEKNGEYVPQYNEYGLRTLPHPNGKPYFGDVVNGTKITQELMGITKDGTVKGGIYDGKKYVLGYSDSGFVRRDASDFSRIYQVLDETGNWKDVEPKVDNFSAGKSVGYKESLLKERFVSTKYGKVDHMGKKYDCVYGMEANGNENIIGIKLAGEEDFRQADMFLEPDSGFSGMLVGPVSGYASYATLKPGAATIVYEQLIANIAKQKGKEEKDILKELAGGSVEFMNPIKDKPGTSLSVAYENLRVDLGVLEFRVRVSPNYDNMFDDLGGFDKAPTGYVNDYEKTNKVLLGVSSTTGLPTIASWSKISMEEINYGISLGTKIKRYLGYRWAYWCDLPVTIGLFINMPDISNSNNYFLAVNGDNATGNFENVFDFRVD